MKILWFTNTPSLYNQGENIIHGGGWISSLQKLVNTKTEISLGICFLSQKDSNKVVDKNTTYYPIKTNNKNNVVTKLINNLTSNIGSQEILLPMLIKVIEDFQPDLINIFGTEKLFGLVQKKTKVPVVIHLQGILNPYLNAISPIGHSILNFCFSSSFFLKNIIGTSPYFHLKKMQKSALTESEIFSLSSNFMGRTDWDRKMVKLYNAKAAYYHVDEILREEFYLDDFREYKKQTSIKIVSTISPSTYKGIDIILKLSKLLKEFNFNFNWTIIGITKNDSFLNYFSKKEKLNLNNYPINFVGKKTASEIVGLHLQSDVFIHPSYIDNSPNSVCEAQILGLPVIACNAGGLSSIIENRVDGFLVPTNGIHEISYILRYEFQDERFINKIKSNAQIIAKKRHEKDKILNSLISTYKNIIVANNNKK